MAGKAHHWIIEEATGPVSIGKCKNCGATKEFINSLDTAADSGQFVPGSLGTGKIKRPRGKKSEVQPDL